MFRRRVGFYISLSMKHGRAFRSKDEIRREMITLDLAGRWFLMCLYFMNCHVSIPLSFFLKAQTFESSSGLFRVVMNRI